MPRTITYQILFPFTVIAPYISHWHFTPLLTVVLSFSRTVQLPELLPNEKEWEVGDKFTAQIDGVQGLVATNVTPKPDGTTIVTLIATEQASSLMVSTLADNHRKNLELNAELIRGVIMGRLRPIHDAILREKEKSWTREGNGLFALENSTTLHQLSQKFVHDDWR